MVVKSIKKTDEILALLLAGPVFFCILFFGTDDIANELLSYILASCIFLTLFCLKGFVISLRDFYFDEKGCTIKFLFFKKTITWDSFKVKRIEKFVHKGKFLFIDLGTREHYKYAVFYPHRMLKFNKMDLYDYVYLLCMFPFSLVYVDLISAESKSEKRYRSPEHPVDEQLFYSKMEEWNIKLEK